MRPALSSIHRPGPIALCLCLCLAAMPLAAGPSPPAEANPEAAAPAALGIAYESHPEKGLLAAGQPTAEQIPQLAAAGYRTVIDLRLADEERGYDEAGAVAAAGMTYVNVPVSSQSLDSDTFHRFFAAVDEAERPVVVHCRSSNRVGALYAAYLAVEKGLPLEEALERGRGAGLSSPELAALVTAYVEERAVREPDGNP